MDPSSPVRSYSASPVMEMLTPRSKVAKMLADIDNASTPSPTTENVTVPVTKPTGRTRDSPSPNQTAASGPFQSVSSDESGDDSDDQITRPLGRAAKRMLSGQRLTTRQSPQLVTEDSDNEDLYSATPAKRSNQKLTPQRRQHSPSPMGTAKSTNSLNLFVSPAKSIVGNDEDDLPRNPFSNRDRLAELVAQKRAEREAKEKEEQARKRSRAAEPSSDLPDEVFEGSQDTPDLEIEQIMSDASRPARQASKKALLEMERETQRLSRQQALAHQMKTKKRFTTSDLFAKFNFRQPSHEQSEETTVEPTSSSVPNSDGVEQMAKEPVSTPPSSPPTPLDRQRAIADYGALSKLMPVREDSIASLAQINAEEELPSAEEIFQKSQVATESKSAQALPRNLASEEVRRVVLEDSDDELEIVPRLPKHLRAFDNVKAPTKNNPGNSSKAIHTLKHLSHIGSYDSMPKKKGSRPSVNPTTLEAQLRTRAKAQARLLQQERIAELRAKGIEILTSEEREKEAEVFENLLEKARLDAVELRKAEKAALKAEGGEGHMEASDDESDDEEYIASGSENEANDEEEDEEENEMLDDAAQESGDEEEELESAEQKLEAFNNDEPLEPESGTKSTATRRSRKSHIIEDEDDDDTAEITAATQENGSAEDEDPFAAFGFGANKTDLMLLSPTQAFNATMQTPTQATQENSLDFLRRIAPPSISSIPIAFDTTGEESQDSMVPGSQVPEAERVNLVWETQPPQTPSLKTAPSGLSETPGWEPTQDPGLPSPWTAGLQRQNTFESIDEHETQSTVQLRVSESPMPSAAHKRGRLVRRQLAAEDSDSEDELPAGAATKNSEENAFNLMARRRKDALTAAEREAAQKEAKGMMDEQAEESEDEYTGLGGDDYVAPETEQDKEMIDSSHIEVNEQELAAHYAERQRLADEAETSKLYKDLTTGALRRKQANAFDLDEDEDEITMRRRQMRQREEARKRKLLLQDDNIAGLAEGRQSKGKEAFLKAIADNDGEDDMMDLSDGGEDDQEPSTQDESQLSQVQTQQGPAVLQEISGNKRRSSDDENETNSRPPAKQRRTASSAFRKPTSLLEVRESLSFLLDEPHAVIPSTNNATKVDEENFFSESEDDEEELEKARQNDGGFAPNPAAFDSAMMPPPRLPASQRRTAAKTAVVDRLSLKRGSSTSSNDSNSGTSAWGASTTGGFRAPSLLRRATAGVASGANERGVTTLSRENSTSSNSSTGSSVKRGGTGKSSLAYQARADERRAIVEASAIRRQENTMRIAELRRSTTAGGALGRGLTGKFE